MFDTVTPDQAHAIPRAMTDPARLGGARDRLAPGHRAGRARRQPQGRARCGEAWTRGRETKGDVFAPNWDFWALTEQPLAELQADYGVPPKEAGL